MGYGVYLTKSIATLRPDLGIKISLFFGGEYNEDGRGEKYMFWIWILRFWLKDTLGLGIVNATSLLIYCKSFRGLTDY